MDEKTNRITEGLDMAMRAETDGYHFYAMAANSVQDQRGREVLQILAQEELMHLRFLKVQYRSFLNTGKADTSAQLGSKADLSGESPIFSADLKLRIADAHFEMSALSIGIQLELNAQLHYRKLAEEAGDEALKKFYLELADWESGHYHALLRQQDALKEDYWSAGGFAPF